MRWLAPLFVLCGCDCGPHQVDWDVDVTDDATSAVEVCILAGECPEDGVASCADSAVLRYTDHFSYADGGLLTEGHPAPPRLPEGRYCFVARARDASCVVIATGTAEHELPRDRVVIELTPLAAPFAECCGMTCDGAGNCLADAGPSCVDESPDDCRVPQCNAAGECELQDAPHLSPCHEVSDTPCTNAACISGVCRPDAIPTARGTPCADDGRPCTTSGCVDGTCIPDYSVAVAGSACEAAPTDSCGMPGCDTNGDCNPALLPAPDGSFCPDSDGDPCTENRCELGDCRSRRVVDEGDQAPEHPFHMRCCVNGAGQLRMVNILTNENHCGGCRMACRGGSECRYVGEDRMAAACRCDSASDCPNTGSGWTCGSGLRCRCRNDRDCRLGQRCNSEALCVYGD